MNQAPIATRADLLPSISVFLCGAIWGGFWFPLRLLAEMGVGGAWVSLIFAVVAMLAPLPWIILKFKSLEDFWAQVFTGFLIGFGFTLYNISFALTDVLHVILLFYLTPIWSTLIATCIYGERLTWPRGLAIAAGFLGMALILGYKNGIPVPQRLGDWLSLLSGILWAFGTTRSHRSPTSQVALPAFAFAVGCFVTSAAALLIAHHTGSALSLSSNIWPAMPWIVGFALIIFVPPNYVVLWASQRLDSGRIGILLLSEVMVGSITAALYAGEKFGPVEIIGTALIICAGLVEVLGRR